MTKKDTINQKPKEETHETGRMKQKYCERKKRTHKDVALLSNNTEILLEICQWM